MVTDSFGFSLTDVGYYAGWLNSAYYISQVFSSIILGQLSDIKGRRNIMFTGMAGNSVKTLVFGMSRVFWLALLSPLVCGLVNGNIGVVKYYVRRLRIRRIKRDPIRCAQPIGTILGPILGGALTRPALQYPTLLFYWFLWEVPLPAAMYHLCEHYGSFSHSWLPLPLGNPSFP